MTAQVGAETAEADRTIEALFAQARRRRRRIRLVRCGVAVAAAALAAALGLAWHAHQAGRGGARPRTAGPAARHPQPGPLLAWVTPGEQLIIGSLSTFAWQPAGEVNVDFAAPIVPFGGHLYWVNQAGDYVDGAFWPRTIESLNPATGTSADIAPGEFVFPSASGRRLQVSLSDIALAELPASRGRRATEWSLPAGWYLPGGAGIAVAGGIVVQSADAPARARPAELAVWDPVTGRVRRLGRADGVIGAWTSPDAGYSLLAWMPAGCRFPACPITITNTVTLGSRTLRSPLGHGFVLGGAFAPNGRQLAVFVNDSDQSGGQPAQLAIASVGTGVVRVVPAVRLTVGEDADWIRWLPGGSLVTLANRDYLVAAATLAARPFHLAGQAGGINYSAELLPPGWPAPRRGRR